LAAAAAVVGLLAGVGGTLLVSGEPARPDQTVVAQTQLAGLKSSVPAGAARVVGKGTSRRLLLDVPALPAGRGYHEVWLLDKKASRLVSLGVVAGRHGSYRLPAGLDLTRFPVVDVSVEPVDGDPAHSADSILRGTLRA
ncbi:MAG: anti-sigma factor, partial [Actinomycetes bacterium]